MIRYPCMPAFATVYYIVALGPCNRRKEHMVFANLLVTRRSLVVYYELCQPRKRGIGEPLILCSNLATFFVNIREKADDVVFEIVHDPPFPPSPPNYYKDAIYFEPGIKGQENFETKGNMVKGGK